jgi:hypothetical protein
MNCGDKAERHSTKVNLTGFTLSIIGLVESKRLLAKYSTLMESRVAPMNKPSTRITTIAAALMLGFYCLTTTAAQVTTLTDQLMALMLEKHMPAPVYEQGSNPWPGGSYQLQVFKTGRPEVVSNANNIHVKMPLKVQIVGDMANDLLQVKFKCNTSFDTVGEIVFAPTKPGLMTTLASTVTLPIPPAMADCDGMKFPIDEYLKTLVVQNKKQWELKLDEEIQVWLAK